MSPGLKKWLQKAVAAGLNYNLVKNSMRRNKQTLFISEAVDVPGSENIKIFELARISDKVFNNFTQQHLKILDELSSDCLVSLRTHAQNIKRDSGIAVVEDLGNRITEEKLYFYFGFYTK